MASKTLLAKDIFISYWGLVVADYLLLEYRGEEFQDELRKHIDEKEKSHIDFMEAVKLYTCFDMETMRIGERESPWADGAEGWYDESYAIAEMNLFAQCQGCISCSDDLKSYVDIVSAGLFDRFVEAVFPSVYYWGDRTIVDSGSVRKIFELPLLIVSDQSLLAKFILKRSRDWRKELIHEYCKNEVVHVGYREWLSNLAKC